MPSPESIVQTQLDAYNNRDMPLYLSTFHPDIKIYNFPETSPSIEGHSQLQSVYQNIFEQSPNLHAHLANRIVFNNKVIDHEQITGRMGIDYMEVVAIYEVEEDLITKIHFIRK